MYVHFSLIVLLTGYMFSSFYLATFNSFVLLLTMCLLVTCVLSYSAVCITHSGCVVGLLLSSAGKYTAIFLPLYIFLSFIKLILLTAYSILYCMLRFAVMLYAAHIAS
jgi:hypothetical protein